MRKKLIRYIKRKFGPTYGSPELKELREEITRNALKRYEEAIANGSDERQAYDAAVGSVGDLSELFDSLNITERRRRLKISVIAVIFSAFLLAVIIAALVQKGLSGVFAVLMILTLPLGAVAYGVISLVSGTRKKALCIVSIAIGGYLMFIAFFIIPGMLFGEPHYKFDFTADKSNIASVEIVTVSALDYKDGVLYEDGLAFNTEKSIEPSEWGSLLSGVSELDYRYRDISVKKLNGERGRRMLLIRFIRPESGLSFVLIGQNCPCFGELSENGVVIRESGYYSSSKEWEDLINRYDESTR